QYMLLPAISAHMSHTFGETNIRTEGVFMRSLSFEDFQIVMPGRDAGTKKHHAEAVQCSRRIKLSGYFIECSVIAEIGAELHGDIATGACLAYRRDRVNGRAASNDLSE